MYVLKGDLNVFGHVLDALRENGDLDLRGACVTWMTLELCHGLPHPVHVLFHLEQHT